MLLNSRFGIEGVFKLERLAFTSVEGGARLGANRNLYSTTIKADLLLFVYIASLNHGQLIYPLFLSIRISNHSRL
jgi:hypothetical protein